VDHVGFRLRSIFELAHSEGSCGAQPSNRSVHSVPLR
jgi:hypothetical protein